VFVTRLTCHNYEYLIWSYKNFFCSPRDIINTFRRAPFLIQVCLTAGHLKSHANLTLRNQSGKWPLLFGIFGYDGCQHWSLVGYSPVTWRSSFITHNTLYGTGVLSGFWTMPQLRISLQAAMPSKGASISNDRRGKNVYAVAKMAIDDSALSDGPLLLMPSYASERWT